VKNDEESALDLELPLQPEYRSQPPKLSLEQYVNWCEEMRRAGLVRQERSTPSPEEFVM
jgi:hypothetical protein